MTKRRLALEPRKYWTAEEDARLIASWADVRAGNRTARQVAADFPGRRKSTSRQRQGLASARDDHPDRFDVSGATYSLKGKR